MATMTSSVVADDVHFQEAAKLILRPTWGAKLPSKSDCARLDPRSGGSAMLMVGYINIHEFQEYRHKLVS
ncbi:hypothetical protein [Mesorhizobium captivum]|uniref:hypothetical protein n=1 Tax=Mesorhizobium captivum TaxID=3072319 RepID=UPI002A243C29|nr:hypothetical protein [Mesorhizobium sp. VK3C]MDX8448223.1 hypothetical protein [Mesorhizobium sp. VK3C]